MVKLLVFVKLLLLPTNYFIFSTASITSCLNSAIMFITSGIIASTFGNISSNFALLAYTLLYYSWTDFKALMVVFTHQAFFSSWVLALVEISLPYFLSYCSTSKSRFSNRISSIRLTFFSYWSFNLRIDIGKSLYFSRLTSSCSAKFLKTSCSATDAAFSIFSPKMSFYSKAVSVI